MGCVEAIASGMGMDRRARALRPEHPDSRLSIPENARCSLKELFALADQGDPMCSRIAADAVTAVANLIMNLVRTTDPDTVVLGGGVVSDGWLLDRVKAQLNATTMRFVRNGVLLTRIDPNTVCLIGAAMVGFHHVRREI